MRKKKAKPTEKDYCSQTCGAKCCYVYDKNHQPIAVCPQLDLKSNLCKMYVERYEKKVPYSFKLPVINNSYQMYQVDCGEVKKDLLGRGVLPPKVERLCCYNRPDLIKG